MQEIADEAGVAKPTVYNHLTDKGTLFREALLTAADVVSAETLAAVDTAEQYLALLTGPIEARSHMGARKIPPTELRTVAEAATDTFLRAYLKDPEKAAP